MDDTASHRESPQAIDHLILGGGSAGCVLAARLSEDATRRVVLVEAGRNIGADDMPAAIASRYPGRAYLDPRNIWGHLKARFAARPDRGQATSRRRYEQAKLLGGGSAINALMANRGAPADYDEWAALGATGWHWQACLPWFIAIERDVDGQGPDHGHNGPLSIRRIADTNLSPFVAGVMQTLAEQGYPPQADQNGAWQDGTFKATIAASDTGQRLPTSVAWLTPEVRQRPNLEIVTESQAQRIVFDGRRAIGAVVAHKTGAPQTIYAREVVVASGAIHSPTLLMRSGVGPAEQIAACGITPVADCPAIGSNLMEHPSIAVASYLRSSARESNDEEHHEQGVWRFSSALPGTPTGDMHASILARSGWHSVGQRVGSLFFWVNKSYSRGRVALNPSNVDGPPQIEFDMLGDTRDLERLKMALRLGARTLQHHRMEPYGGPVFPASYSPRVAALAMPGWVNRVQRGLFAGVLDLAGRHRHRVISAAVSNGITIERLLADDQALTEFVRSHVGGTWHASGTCRMGQADDPQAATSPTGCVHGVTGLRVCDASLMPSIPCANTNLPTLMIAERIAHAIRSE